MERFRTARRAWRVGIGAAACALALAGCGKPVTITVTVDSATLLKEPKAGADAVGALEPGKLIEARRPGPFGKKGFYQVPLDGKKVAYLAESDAAPVPLPATPMVVQVDSETAYATRALDKAASRTLKYGEVVQVFDKGSDPTAVALLQDGVWVGFGRRASVVPLPGAGEPLGQKVVEAARAGDVLLALRRADVLKDALAPGPAVKGLIEALRAGALPPAPGPAAFLRTAGPPVAGARAYVASLSLPAYAKADLSGAPVQLLELNQTVDVVELGPRSAKVVPGEVASAEPEAAKKEQKAEEKASSPPPAGEAAKPPDATASAPGSSPEPSGATGDGPGDGAAPVAPTAEPGGGGPADPPVYVDLRGLQAAPQAVEALVVRAAELGKAGKTEEQLELLARAASLQEQPSINPSGPPPEGVAELFDVALKAGAMRWAAFAAWRWRFVDVVGWTAKDADAAARIEDAVSAAIDALNDEVLVVQDVVLDVKQLEGLEPGTQLVAAGVCVPGEAPDEAVMKLLEDLHAGVTIRRARMAVGGAATRLGCPGFAVGAENNCDYKTLWKLDGDETVALGKRSLRGLQFSYSSSSCGDWFEGERGVKEIFLLADKDGRIVAVDGEGPHMTGSSIDRPFSSLESSLAVSGRGLVATFDTASDDCTPRDGGRWENKREGLKVTVDGDTIVAKPITTRTVSKGKCDPVPEEFGD